MTGQQAQPSNLQHNPNNAAGVPATGSGTPNWAQTIID